MATACRVCGGIVDSCLKSGRICKKCDAIRYKAWGARDPRRTMLLKARTLAARKGRECTLVQEDIPELPDVCPVFGYPLVWGSGPSHPSLDRIDSTKGYVPGNLQIISWRANKLKSDATFDEIEKLYFYMGRNTDE